jgi:hypothetical protein
MKGEHDMSKNCPVCQHEDDHPPREKDDGIKPPFCPECQPCRDRRASLKSPVPPGLASLPPTQRQ